MAYLVINSVTFSGLPNGTGNQSAWQPTGYDETPTKIGVTLVAANGTRNRVERGTTKRAWKLTWEGCNYATMQTIRTISLLTSTFAFSDVGGTAYTVQTEEPAEISFQKNSATDSYWSVTLTLYQP